MRRRRRRMTCILLCTNFFVQSVSTPRKNDLNDNFLPAVGIVIIITLIRGIFFIIGSAMMVLHRDEWLIKVCIREVDDISKCHCPQMKFISRWSPNIINAILKQLGTLWSYAAALLHVCQDNEYCDTLFKLILSIGLMHDGKFFLFC